MVALVVFNINSRFKFIIISAGLEQEDFISK